MNRYESEIWHKANVAAFSAQAKKELEENGSALSQAIRHVLNNTHLSESTEKELKQLLEMDRKITEDKLRNWDNVV